LIAPAGRFRAALFCACRIESTRSEAARDSCCASSTLEADYFGPRAIGTRSMHPLRKGAVQVEHSIRSLDEFLALFTPAASVQPRAPLKHRVIRVANPTASMQHNASK
jgi:hypothetical protein